MASRVPASMDTLSGQPAVSKQVRSFSVSQDRKSTRLNSSHSQISYAVFCLKKKKTRLRQPVIRQLSHQPSYRLGQPTPCDLLPALAPSYLGPVPDDPSRLSRPTTAPPPLSV